jgi:hypothetical protein
MLLIVDENVPASVGRVFAERGHEVVSALEVTLPGTPDDVIARYVDVHVAMVVTWNRRDFKRLSAVVSPDNVRRFRRLSWIAFHCNEARGAGRARRWIEAIEFHLSLARGRRDTRLMIDITETTFTVLG